MYYCKARYYVPRWGRRLTPDNPRYLELGNINGLNLFVCCNNNPLIFVDDNGKIAITTTFLLCGLVALLLLSYMIYNVAVSRPKKNLGGRSTNIFDNDIIINEEKMADNYADIESKIEGIELSVAAFLATLIYTNKEKKHRHHIVAKKDWWALPSRMILNACDIEVDSARNTVYIDSGLHKVMHTNAYYAILNMSITVGYGIAGKEGVETVLNIYQFLFGRQINKWEI